MYALAMALTLLFYPGAALPSSVPVLNGVTFDAIPSPSHLTHSTPDDPDFSHHGNRVIKPLQYLPLVLAVTAPLDDAIMPLRDNFERNDTLQDVSRDVSFAGQGAVIAGAGILGYLVGRVAHSRDLRVISGDIIKGAILTTLVVVPMKWATGRIRPFQLEPSDSPYRFEPFSFKGYNRSLPSGHATLSFMTATVISRHTKKTWIKVLAYTVATAVAVSRVTYNRHHPSDVGLGAVLGITIGFYVTR